GLGLPAKVKRKLQDTNSTLRKQVVALFSQYPKGKGGLLLARHLTHSGRPGPALSIQFVVCGADCQFDPGTFSCEGTIERVVKVFWVRSKVSVPLTGKLRNLLHRRGQNKQIASDKAAADQREVVHHNPIYDLGIRTRLCVNFDFEDGNR